MLHWCTLKVRGARAARTGEQSIGTLCFSLSVDSISQKTVCDAVLSECECTRPLNPNERTLTVSCNSLSHNLGSAK